jgi:nucleoside-diphosphate-sugar epimerase
VKILVVGSSGFLGSRIVVGLLRDGHDVISTCRIPRPGFVSVSAWDNLDISSMGIDLIINAAGKYGKVESQDEIKDTLDSNVGIAVSIANSIMHVNIGALNLSSYFELLPLNSKTSNTYYTKSKILSNHVLELYSSIYEKRYSRIILFDNYDKDLSRDKILDSLLKAAITQKEIVLKNSKSRLNLLSTTAIVDGIRRIVTSMSTENPTIGRSDIKNLKNYSILELINIIEKELGKKINYEDLGFEMDGESDRLLNDMSYRLQIPDATLDLDRFVQGFRE